MDSTFTDLLGTASLSLSSDAYVVVTTTTESATSTTSMDAAASSSSLSSFLSSASSVLAEASSASSSAASAIATATGGSSSSTQHPSSYKIVGILLAVVSGLFIGSSFVFKKKGLISVQNKPGFVAGEGHGYLKSPMWWTGMIIMIIGEVCNFVAYAFTEAILVTPLGALSVVVCAVLSSIFLKETLTFFGKVGCLLCILGATIIALNGPTQSSASTIPEFQKLFLSPGFLVYTSLVIVTSLVLIFFVAPRYGKKNMMVYIMVCSLIGGISVVCTSGLGGSILTSINGNNQFKHWFMYFLIGFVVVTLLTEINYLNKALELFNTALVTPSYYCVFTFATLVSDCILNKGFDVPVVDIITVVFGFLTICCGIILLQMSKVDPVDLAQQVKLGRKSTLLLSAMNKVEHIHENEAYDPKDPNAEKRARNLDLEDPGIDSIRGFVGLAGSIHRAVSARKSIQSRRKKASLLHQYGQHGRYDDEEGGFVYGDDRWKERRAFNGLTTSGAHSDGLVRHQLYDAPMPSDAADKISLYTHSDKNRPDSDGNMTTPTRTRAQTIGFEEDVIEHRYPRKGEKGEVVHQPHYTLPYPPVASQYLRPSNSVLSTSTTGASDTAGPSAASIIDAYTPDVPTPKSLSFPEGVLTSANTTKPPPALRQQGSVGFPPHSTSSNIGTAPSSGSSGSSSTANVQRGNKSLSSMLTEHFAASAIPESGLHLDTFVSKAPSPRSASKSRSPTSNFFSSLKGGISHASHHGHHTRDDDGDDEELDREERLGLVGNSAEFGVMRSGDATPRESEEGRSSFEDIDHDVREDDEQEDEYARDRVYRARPTRKL